MSSVAIYIERFLLCFRNRIRAFCTRLREQHPHLFKERHIVCKMHIVAEVYLNVLRQLPPNLIQRGYVSTYADAAAIALSDRDPRRARCCEIGAWLAVAIRTAKCGN